MQIKYENDGAESMSEDNGISIYSSLESLLKIPQSMSREFSERALRAQECLDKWSNHRRKMVRNMEAIAETLDNWEKGCAISTTVGSSVGVASGFAIIGGLVLMPPVAIAGLIVGTAAGVSNLATGLSKAAVWKTKHNELTAIIETDSQLFDQLLKSREELMEAIKKIMEDEEFAERFKIDRDMENKLKTVFGMSVTGITALGTRFAVTSMGRLSSSLVKGVLHGVAAIGIILDGATLAMSVKTLKEGSVSEFGTEILKASGKIEMHRQKVVKEYLNADVWNDEDDEDVQEASSETGSIEMISPTMSMMQPSQ